MSEAALTVTRAESFQVPAIVAPEVRALKAELAAEKDRFLRLSADFDNFRKRVAQGRCREFESGHPLSSGNRRTTARHGPLLDSVSKEHSTQRAKASRRSSASAERSRTYSQSGFRRIASVKSLAIAWSLGACVAELPPVFPRLGPRHKIGYAPTPFRRKESHMQSPLTFRFNDGTEVRRLGLNGRTRG